MLLRGCSRVHCWLCVSYGSSRTAKSERRRVGRGMALQSRARGGLCWRVRLRRRVGGTIVWKRARVTLDLLRPTYLLFYCRPLFLRSLNESISITILVFHEIAFTRPISHHSPPSLHSLLLRPPPTYTPAYSAPCTFPSPSQTVDDPLPY